eukprot:TRINITY_DN7082_c0_g1_i2.p1 TRINITY_DN7082_c0_g1~~TRINITY_DN7082_c0_g1_i2.p1  ORF type:complete len:1010 (+),score=221.43 TRINITY_DN7082_c0_g1_i2:128-3157(+)
MTGSIEGTRAPADAAAPAGGQAASPSTAEAGSLADAEATAAARPKPAKGEFFPTATSKQKGSQPPQSDGSSRFDTLLQLDDWASDSKFVLKKASHIPICPGRTPWPRPPRLSSRPARDYALDLRNADLLTHWATKGAGPQQADRAMKKQYATPPRSTSKITYKTASNNLREAKGARMTRGIPSNNCRLVKEQEWQEKYSREPEPEKSPTREDRRTGTRSLFPAQEKVTTTVSLEEQLQGCSTDNLHPEIVELRKYLINRFGSRDKAFQALDLSKSGNITMLEMHTGFNVLRIPFEEICPSFNSNCNLVFREMDYDKNWLLDMDDFLGPLPSKPRAALGEEKIIEKAKSGRQDAACGQTALFGQRRAQRRSEAVPPGETHDLPDEVQGLVRFSTAAEAADAAAAVASEEVFIGEEALDGELQSERLELEASGIREIRRHRAHKQPVELREASKSTQMTSATETSIVAQGSRGAVTALNSSSMSGEMSTASEKGAVTALTSSSMAREMSMTSQKGAVAAVASSSIAREVSFASQKGGVAALTSSSMAGELSAASQRGGIAATATSPTRRPSGASVVRSSKLSQLGNSERSASEGSNRGAGAFAGIGRSPSTSGSARSSLEVESATGQPPMSSAPTDRESPDFVRSALELAEQQFAQMRSMPMLMRQASEKLESRQEDEPKGPTVGSFLAQLSAADHLDVEAAPEDIGSLGSLQQAAERVHRMQQELQRSMMQRQMQAPARALQLHHAALASEDGCPRCLSSGGVRCHCEHSPQMDGAKGALLAGQDCAERLTEACHVPVGRKIDMVVTEKNLQIANSAGSRDRDPNRNDYNAFHTQLAHISYPALRTALDSPQSNRELGAGAFHQQDDSCDPAVHYKPVRIFDSHETIVVQSLWKPDLTEQGVGMMRYQPVHLSESSAMDSLTLPYDSRGAIPDGCPMTMRAEGEEEPRLIDYTKHHATIGDSSFHTYVLPKSSHSTPGDITEVEEQIAHVKSLLSLVESCEHKELEAWWK